MRNLLFILCLLTRVSALAQEENNTPTPGIAKHEKSAMTAEEREAARKAWFEQFESRFEKASYRHEGLEVPYRTLHLAPEKSGKEALVIFLHNSKGRGVDNRGQLRGSVQTVVKNLEKVGEKVLLVAPQCRPDRRWNENYATLGDKMPIVLKGLIGQLLADHPEVDPTRIYLVGDSSGGAGVLYALDAYPKLFAGAIAAASYPHKSNSAAAIAKTPVALSYSDFDPEKQALTRDLAEKIDRKGGEVRYTPLKGYDNEGTRFSPELLEWMLSFRR